MRTSIPGAAAGQERCRGFSLIELMVVVSIVAVLVSIAGVYLSSPRDQRALTHSAAETVRLLQQLRNRAMSTGNAVILRVSAHQPLPDMMDGWAPLGMGTANSQFEVFDSVGANCTPREADVLIPAEVMDPTDPTLPYRHTVVTRIAPVGTGGIREVCFTPTGRVVDPLTNRPFAAVGSSMFGGRFFIEYRPASCAGGDCHLRPFRTTVVVEFNGLVERMDESFNLSDL